MEIIGTILSPNLYINLEYKWLAGNDVNRLEIRY